MNIIFEHLQIQNFKSIGDPIIIDFSDFNGLNFIIGNNKDNPGAKNGAGKTTICDAIVFALYGKTIKAVSNQYIPNRNYKKKAESYAKLQFSADEIRYRTECYCTKSSIKMYLYKENTESEEGWDNITQASVIKTKEYIQDEIIKCPYALFKSAIFISSSDCLNFYENMTKQQKREYIENIFNLDCFGKMYDSIKNDINSSKKEVSYLSTDLQRTGKQLDEITEKFKNYNEDIKNRLDILKNSLITEAAEYKNKQESADGLKKEIDKIGSAESEYDNLCCQESALSSESVKIDKDIFKASTKIDSINQVISKIDGIKDGLCDKCSRIIESKYNYRKQEDTIAALKSFIEKNKSLLDENSLKLENIKKEKEKQTIIKQKKNSLEQKYSGLNYELTALKCNLKKIKEEYQNLQNKNENPFASLMESLTAALKETQDKLVEINSQIKYFEIVKSICSETGVKQYIIKDIVVLLNSLIQKYLNEIGAEYIVYFDETFDFKFLTVNGECEYNSFSAGERQRIQIATILAFRDLILNGKINSNIFIIDEVLDMAIDSIAIKKIINILLKKTVEMNQALFIISHRSEITEENIFNHILEITKENGISTLKII